MLHDLRYGMRILRKNPTFALVAILALALGTGANAAIFQLVNALRLRSLPVEQPNELVSIGIDRHGKGRVGRGYPGRSIFTEPLWQEIRSEQQAFSSLFAWGNGVWDLSGGGEAVLANGFYVSGGFFDALGVHAQIGRLFTEQDDQKGCGSSGVVLSHGFWQARLGGHPGVIGQTIMLDRRPFPVIGVTPPGFFGVEVGRSFDVALPLCAEPLLRGDQAGTGRRAVWWLDIMGRLKPGWTVERAGAHVATISPGVFQATVSPTYSADWAKNYTSSTLTARPAGTGVSNLRSRYATPLWALLGAAGLVLLLTCLNLANLMLARSTVRGQEVAVRLAIGASRRRVVRQMLSESVLLAGLGAVGGLLLARWISQTLVTFLNARGNRIFLDLTPDWRVFAFLATVTFFTCVLFGLSPALKATRRDVANAMQPGGRSSTEGHEALALRRGLVVVQVALSMVIVVGALLFGRTLKNLAAVDLGFDPDVVVVAVDLSRTAVRPEARRQTFAAIVTRLQQVPGVRHAAEALIVPLDGSDWNGRIVTGGAVQDGDAHFDEVGGNYFRVMGTPLLAGRTFDGRDRPDAAKSVIVNETFARRYFPNADPIGKTFQMELPPGSPQPTYHIVGLVRDAKFLPYLEEFRIPDESDDMVGGLRAAGWQLHLECLPDGIRVREIPPCERLVHDYRLRRVGPVSTVEHASRKERRPHHAEVVGADFIEMRVAVLHRTARDDASVPITAVERHEQCLGGVANAGDLLEPRDDGSEGLRPRLGPHPGSAQVDSHHRHVGIEAQVDRAEVFQGAPEEQRADHEHHRERDLHDHQPAPQRERLVSFSRRSAAALHGTREIAARDLE